VPYIVSGQSSHAHVMLMRMLTCAC
jgi:hypothetical protein